MLKYLLILAVVVAIIYYYHTKPAPEIFYDASETL